MVADKDGFLYFWGRRDAMIKTSGFRVSPTEVEEVASDYPGVTECVAFGVLNADIGQDVALAYASADPIDEESFRKFLRDRLPSHMVPRHLVREVNFPATGNQGKIDRQRVLHAARARLGLGDAD